MVQDLLQPDCLLQMSDRSAVAAPQQAQVGQMALDGGPPYGVAACDGDLEGLPEGCAGFCQPVALQEQKASLLENVAFERDSCTTHRRERLVVPGESLVDMVL